MDSSLEKSTAGSLNTFKFMQQPSPNSYAPSLIFADYQACQITPAAESRVVKLDQWNGAAEELIYYGSEYRN
jgi:hypothetical protein